MSPVSESVWGISGYIIFWVLFAIAIALFSQRVYFLYRLMRLGREENRSDNMGQRVKAMLFEVIPQWCNLKSVTKGDFAGIGHALLFWGFSLFLISYVVYIGLADKDGCQVFEYRIGDFLGRQDIRDRAHKAALNRLRLKLLENCKSA